MDSIDTSPLLCIAVGTSVARPVNSTAQNFQKWKFLRLHSFVEVSWRLVHSTISFYSLHNSSASTVASPENQPENLRSSADGFSLYDKPMEELCLIVNQLIVVSSSRRSDASPSRPVILTGRGTEIASGRRRPSLEIGRLVWRKIFGLQGRCRNSASCRRYPGEW